MFQQLEAHLHSEVNTLGYPAAALFAFCVALVAYNVLAVVKGALRGLHGEQDDPRHGLRLLHRGRDRPDL